MNALVEAIIELLKFTWLLLQSFTACILNWTLPIEKKDISKDIVLITGAAGGLGKELALQFHLQRSTVILVDLDKVGCEQTKKYIRSNSDDDNEVFIYECDVSDYKRVQDVINDIRETIGAVSILVNNAGIVNTPSLTDISTMDYERTISVNFLAHAWTVKCCLPTMFESGRGHVVTIASILGLVACGQINDYCASKFASVGFHESLTADLMVMRKKGVEGVFSTLVCPSHISTNMFAGATTRFPRLFPALRPESVASDIVDAVRKNKTKVILPKRMKLLEIAKPLLPSETFFHLSDFFIDYERMFAHLKNA